MEKKTYKNSIESKENIKKAIIKLIEENHNSTSITVLDVAKEANINRGTFYSHFKNLDEAIKDIENDTIERLKVLLTSFSESYVMKQDFSSLVDCISLFLKENERFNAYVLLSSNEQYFVGKIKKEIITLIMEKYVAKKDDLTSIAVAFYVNGMMGLYHDYYARILKVDFNSLNLQITRLLNMIYAFN